MNAEAASTDCVLGFDVGAQRTGIAIGNLLTLNARPLAMLRMRNDRPDWEQLDSLLRDWRPGQLVIGEPLTLDGQSQAATERARNFARQIGQRYALPVHLVDERSTSREAAKRFAGLRRGGQARRRDAGNLDALAAQIILERWFAQATSQDLPAFPF